MPGYDLSFGKARLGDAGAISALIAEFNDSPIGTGVDREIRDYFVARSSGEVVGCVGLHFVSGSAAELRSLAVRNGFRGRGIGSRLVELSLYEAKLMGAVKVLAYTGIPEFFRRLKFEVANVAVPDACASNGCVAVVFSLEELGYVLKY
ncbi:GNAT family N-acetyltransferase [Candidatus Woesearchaeota archaeon]|nr:GNAT family N-acetyltransferase [Candidatus Woesearchaeota archaeon]